MKQQPKLYTLIEFYEGSTIKTQVYLSLKELPRPITL